MSRERMGNADAAWLHMDRPTNLMIVNSVWLLDEPVAFAQVKEIFTTRLVDVYPRLRQRVKEGPAAGAWWVDDQAFDLGRHLHHRGLPQPGGVAALQTLIGDLMAAPLDRAKPLWDAYLIDGPDAGCALLVRMHHCIADGIALAQVMLTLTDETATDAGPGFGDAHSPRRSLSGALGLSHGLVHETIETALHPRRRVRSLGQDAQTVTKLLFAPRDGDTAVRGKLSGLRGVAWSAPLGLAEVKAIAHAQHATVNDVLLSAVTGALRRYMLAQDGSAVEVHAIVPVNLRPPDEPIRHSLGNRFGLVFLALPVDIASPGERLQELKLRMDAIKESPEGPLVYAILNAVGMTPVAVEKRLIDLFSAKGTAVLTNVPGPREPVFLAGVPVRAVLAWAPTSGSVGMSLSIFSYRGEVTVGLMVDTAIVPEPQRIIDALAPEIAALRALTPLQSRRRPPAAPQAV